MSVDKALLDYYGVAVVMGAQESALKLAGAPQCESQEVSFTLQVTAHGLVWGVHIIVCLQLGPFGKHADQCNCWQLQDLIAWLAWPEFCDAALVARATPYASACPVSCSFLRPSGAGQYCTMLFCLGIYVACDLSICLSHDAARLPSQLWHLGPWRWLRP